LFFAHPVIYFRQSKVVGSKKLGVTNIVSTKPKVFISYAREDYEAAASIYRFLKDNVCDPWMDVESILPGQDWPLEIQKAIENSDFFIACLSSQSVNKRGFVQSELKNGLEYC
jgi:hypothetical protein